MSYITRLKDCAFILIINVDVNIWLNKTKKLRITFIQEEHIQLIKSYSTDIYNVTKMSISISSDGDENDLIIVAQLVV